MIDVISFHECKCRTEIVSILSKYQKKYNEICPPDGGTILGTPTDIEAAQYIFYEGFDDTIGTELCNAAIPLVVFNVMEQSYGAKFGSIQINNQTEYCIKHPEINLFFTVADLTSGLLLGSKNNGMPLPDDDTYSPGELAAYSYERCRDIFHKITMYLRYGNVYLGH
jgi:hypothetical protein